MPTSAGPTTGGKRRLRGPKAGLSLERRQLWAGLGDRVLMAAVVLATGAVTHPQLAFAGTGSSSPSTAPKSAASPSGPASAAPSTAPKLAAAYGATGSGASSPSAKVTTAAPSATGGGSSLVAAKVATAAPGGTQSAGVAAKSDAPQASTPPAGSAVFFTVEGSPEHGPLTLVPLYCYDQGKQARAVGDACLSLLPAGAMVETAGGPLQLGEAVTPQCPRQPQMGGRRLIGKVKPLPFLYGAWPSLQAVRYVVVPEQNLGWTMAPIEKLAREAITKATAMPVADLSIYQILVVSLGSNRIFQKVYSVAVPDRRGHTQWSGLLIGDAQGRTAAVAADEKFPDVKQYSMQIVGHTDIDHDGKLELLVNTGGDNLDRYSVRTYDGTKLPAVSYWHSCN